MSPDALILTNKPILNDMKTINQIKKEEEDLRVEIDNANYVRDQKEINRIKKRLDFLKMCRIYLETRPSEQYIQGELTRLNNTIEILDERFPAWSAGRSGGGTELKRQYNAVTDISKLRSQVRTLEYLLT